MAYRIVAFPTSLSNPPRYSPLASIFSCAATDKIIIKKLHSLKWFVKMTVGASYKTPKIKKVILLS